MTHDEILLLKKFAESAYPQMRQERGTDLAWIELLSDYSYRGMMESLRGHIKKSKFAPTIADLIEGYDIILDSFNDRIFEQMVRDGIFDDGVVKFDEIANWNRKNRMNKMRLYLLKELPYTPNWYTNMIQEYRSRFDTKYLQPLNQKQIEGGTTK